MANIEAIKKMLKSDEGYRRFMYRDSRGFWTIGYGLCIEEGHGEGMSELVADYALSMSVHARVDAIAMTIQFFDKLPEAAGTVLVCMSYQLGVNGLLEFHKFLAALKVGDYKTASNEMLNSAWAKQTPERAERYSEIIKNL